MKTTFVKDTTFRIDHKDAKYMVSFFDGYAKIDKYVKGVFNYSPIEFNNY